MITSVVISDNVKEIGYEAFRACTNLVKATIGKGVENIMQKAFCDCTKLTEALFLSDAWFVNGNKIDISNSGVAAALLKTYVDDSWCTSTP